MILTLTLSPSLDKSYIFDGMSVNGINYTKKSVLLPGSKGINVSRMLTTLAVDNIALGFCGGYLGPLFKTLLDVENVKYDFVETEAEVRFNVKLADVLNGTSTDINEIASGVTEEEFESLVDLYKDYLSDAEYVVIAGGTREDMPDDVYNTFIRAARFSGKKVLLDVKGEALRFGIEEKPYLISPNIDELSEYAGKKLEALEEIEDVLRNIHNKGVAYAIVTLGSDGALMVCDEGTYKMTPPEVEVKNTTGAGDSFLAGIIYGLKSNSDAIKMLKLAGSISSVKVTKEDTAMPAIIEALSMMDTVMVEKYES